MFNNNNIDDDELFDIVFSRGNDDIKKMAPPQPVTRPVTADCVGVCKSVLGEGCVASVDEGGHIVELRPTGDGVLVAFISLSEPQKGVVHLCWRTRQGDVYQENTFSDLQVLCKILTKHILPHAPSLACLAFS